MFLLKYCKICNICLEDPGFFQSWFDSQFIPCAGMTEGIKSVIHLWAHIFSRWTKLSHFPAEKPVRWEFSSKMQKLECLNLLLAAFWNSQEFCNWFNSKYDNLYLAVEKSTLRTILWFTAFCIPLKTSFAGILHNWIYHGGLSIHQEQSLSLCFLCWSK